MMNATIRSGAILVFLMLSASAHENHDHATGVVKERMVIMESMAKHMKAIAERITERRDLAAIKTEAEALTELASHVSHLFPKGSTQHPTQARSTIWQNWPDFERRARTLETESRKLAGLSPDDVAALEAQRQAVVRACGGCHEKYRVKR
jgi:cytochrome c556